MSEIIASYNNLAVAQGKEEVTSFKNLAAARAALKTLESNMSNDTPEVTDVESEDSEIIPADSEIIPADSKSGPKYNSSKKRGPTQGVGAFCKAQILEGKTNAEILEIVAEQFPTAKTTANCVAYYRARLKAAPAVEAPAVEATDEVAEEAEAA